MPTLPPAVVAGLPCLRFRNQWFSINTQPYEPERRTADLAWSQVMQKPNLSWHSQERKIARLLANVASQ